MLLTIERELAQKRNRHDEEGKNNDNNKNGQDMKPATLWDCTRQNV